MRSPASGFRRPAAGLVIAVVLAVGGAARAATDLSDYDPRSQQWNGMASFVALAEGIGFEVLPVTQLQWDELTADDILFLVYPLERVDPGRLSSFIQAGGNAVIADDFGEGKDAMAALGLILEVGTPRASRYHEGRLWAPIATAQADHPISAEVGDVITNHPAALTRVQGATTVIGFDEGGVVVAGERGTGRFVAVSDPSIFINRMQQFPGDVQLTANILHWLDRHESGKRAHRVVLLRGDVPMYGDPRPFIDDPRGGKVGRSIADLNTWLSERRDWLLTPAAMKVLAGALAIALLGLAFLALPVRRGPRIDGAWLRFARPARRDEPSALVTAADRGNASSLVLACVLRDQVQTLLGDAIGKAEPLYTVPEHQLVSELSAAKGNQAGSALSRVYKRLRALPSRGQAAAPWSTGHLARRDFDALYRDVAVLCRTLGADLPDVQEEIA